MYRFHTALFFILSTISGSTFAAICTDGVDCYCDCTKGPATVGQFKSAACQAKNVPVDTLLLKCEDFEARTLHDDTGAGNFTNAGGENVWGPWYDGTGYGSPGARGFNSYWTRNYGSAGRGCNWRSSMPTPAIGEKCLFDDCFAGEWSAGDLWTADTASCVDIVKSGEFDDQVAGITPNTVFDGTQTYGSRVRQGSTAGVHGRASLSRTVNQVGVTMGLAYASNVGQSGIFNSPWKHEEWHGTAWNSAYWEHWNLGATGVGPASVLPYKPFMFNTGNQSACQTAVNNSTITVGQADCSDVALRIGASSTVYQQSRDFPWGTWGCHRAHIQGMGTTNMSLRLWHNEVLIFEMTGFNGTVLRNSNYNGFFWNNYANANQGDGGVPTSQTTYRYEDNVHVREGVPVSCAQIGFGPADTISPAPPTGLTVN